MKETAWNVTPQTNLDSILSLGLLPHKPEEYGDLAISLFKTKENALEQTNKWLFRKWKGVTLCLLEIDIHGLFLTETFTFELITTNSNPITPERIVGITILEINCCNRKNSLNI